MARRSSICTSRSVRPRSTASRCSEPGVRSVQPLHQCDDAILEMPQCNRFVARLLHLFDLAGQTASAPQGAVTPLSACVRWASARPISLMRCSRLPNATFAPLIASWSTLARQRAHGRRGRLRFHWMLRALQFAQGADRALQLHHCRGVLLGTMRSILCASALWRRCSRRDFPPGSDRARRRARRPGRVRFLQARRRC